MKNYPIITFLQRTWMLLIAFAAFDWAALTEHHFKPLGKWVSDPDHGGIWVAQTPMEWAGPLLWAIPFGIMVWLLSLLSIHLYYRETIDADANDGTTVYDWKSCTSFQRVLVATIVRIGIFIGLCILCASLARAGTPPPVDQTARWKEALVSPKYRMALDVEMALYQRTKPRYEVIQAMRPNGVPAPILFCLHYRESDNDFRCSLAQGDSLMHRSRNVPRGRLPDKEPPYTWEQCAIDAVYVVDRLDLKDWSHLGTALSAIVSYNGTGYDRRGVPSPYLWAATNQYVSGKFVSDGRYSSTAVDKQLGCAALLICMRDRGIKLPFVP